MKLSKISQQLRQNLKLNWSRLHSEFIKNNQKKKIINKFIKTHSKFTKMSQQRLVLESSILPTIPNQKKKKKTTPHLSAYHLGMEKPLLECVEKLEEICSLVLDQMKIIKDIQVNYQSLQLASRGLEWEKPIKEELSNASLKIRRPWESYKIKPFQLHTT